MRRRGYRKPALTLSLFPFLAVLVCTMGALIVLLVTVVQKAQVDVSRASTARAARRAAEEEELAARREKKEVHDWRRQVLETQREELRQQLAGQRLTLSHLEDHIRRLEEKWRQLSLQAREMEQLGELKQRGAAEVREELAQIRAAAEKARQELEEVRRTAAHKRRTFAIVPYDGPNGTRRRPIYIECTDEGVILQPEAVVLRPADFDGSLGPGNPLDAALRTTREYLARRGDNKLHGEPYPLLIVRPSGTVAYAVARAAIKSWDDEFGYELVDADMELAYPRPDANLRNELERSVADARSRQVMLAMAMPGRFGRSPAAGLVASTAGGFRSLGGGSAKGGGSGSSTDSGPGFAQGGTPRTGGTFSGTFQQASTSPGSGPSGPPYPGSPSPSRPELAGTAGTAGGSAGTAENVSPASASGVPGGSASMGTANANQAGPAGPSLAGGTGAAGGMDLPPASEPTDGPAGTPGSSASRSTKSAPSAAGSAAGKKGKPPSNVTPLAASRGDNWGLPNRGLSATGYTRYISVQCMANQLVILPEQGDFRPPLVVAAPEELAPAMDAFVSAIWKRTQSWGIAAENGYWKPVLRVSVGPNADARFEELRTLLDRSGLVVERK